MSNRGPWFTNVNRKTDEELKDTIWGRPYGSDKVLHKGADHTGHNHHGKQEDREK